MSLAQILAVLLAASVAGNAVLGWAYLGQRDTATAAKIEQRQASSVAQECSKGTESLALAGLEREANAAPKRREAQEKAAQHNREADRILAAPPAVPGNACASAQAELDSWWAGRVKP